MPEPVVSNYIIGQLARRVGLPLRCGGSLTASKIEDAQAAYESADSMHSTVLAGSNYTLHSAGWLEGGLATGYEKLVMDADRLGSYQKILAGLPPQRPRRGSWRIPAPPPALRRALGDHMLGSCTNLEYWSEFFKMNSSSLLLSNAPLRIPIRHLSVRHIYEATGLR